MFEWIIKEGKILQERFPDEYAQILLAAQSYADETTVPCTEWLAVDEIVDIVLQEAKKYVMAHT